MVAEQVIGAAVYDFRRVLNLSPNELDVFVTLLGNAVIFTVLMHAKRMSYADLFHATTTSVKATAALLVPLVLLLIPALVLVATTLTDMLVSVLPLSRWEEQTFERMAANNLPSIVATCLLAPMLEEMLFRGIVLRSFLHQYPRSRAILASAFFFGLAHLNIYQFVVAFMLGVVAGWLYERSRSLIPCIALHGFYNSTLVVLDMAAQGSDVAPEPEVSVLFWGLALAAAAAAGHTLRRLLRTRSVSAPLTGDAP